MLDKVCILAAPGWPLRLARHVFSSSARGELLHFIDGDLRATVPPEGWAGYVAEWPDAAFITEQLKRAPAAVEVKTEPDLTSTPAELAGAELDAAKWAGTTTDPARKGDEGAAPAETA